MRIARYHNLFLVFIALANGAYLDLTGGQRSRPLDEYRGFQVDYNEVLGDPNLQVLRVALNRQIDMVLAVGVSDNVLDFFRKVPILVLAGPKPFAGHYDGKRRKAVRLTSDFLAKGRKPALLHELLHAFHDQRMPEGFKNQDVLRYYQRAKAMHAYDAESHMMASVGEFFASAATAFLYGVTPLEPFEREKIRRSQPQFYQFLKSLLGPHAGQYQGSL